VYVKHNVRQTLVIPNIIRYRHSCAHDTGKLGSAELTSACGVSLNREPLQHTKSTSAGTSQNSRIAQGNDDDDDEDEDDDDNDNINNLLGFTT